MLEGMKCSKNEIFLHLKNFGNLSDDEARGGGQVQLGGSGESKNFPDNWSDLNPRNVEAHFKFPLGPTCGMRDSFLHFFPPNISFHQHFRPPKFHVFFPEGNNSMFVLAE